MGEHSGVRVIVFPRRGRLLPRDAGALRRELASRGVRPVIVRVAASHVEVEVPEGMVEKAAEEASRLLGSKPLGVYSAYTRRDGWLEAFLSLSRAQRFWEAHTAAEAGWRLEGVGWAQALAVAAGALAKAQEGSLEPVGRMAVKASTIAERAGAPGLVDARCLEAEAEKAYRGLEAELERCLAIPGSRNGYNPRRTPGQWGGRDC
ncbi:MAG: DUF309 domain-containing protein, partial [Desulfurococcales archaeon]|nr:DUF309 domain-containing protein [Desulfurococcales archaeon]